MSKKWTYEDYKKEHEALFAKGASCYNWEDGDWFNTKLEFLNTLKERTEELVNDMIKQYPDVEMTELINLVKTSYESTYKRNETLVYSFPQYTHPYTG